MGQEDDLRGLAKAVDFIRAVSILFLIIHIHWYCHPTWAGVGWTVGLIDKLLKQFDRSTILPASPWVTKGFHILLLTLSCLGTRGVKNEEYTWGHIYNTLLPGLVLFTGSWPIRQLPTTPLVTKAGVYVLVMSAGYVFLMPGDTWISRILKQNVMNDVFNAENESFERERQLMVNEGSVSIPTKYYYKQKWNNGWINVIDPYRASIVLGTPSFGKSFAVVNNYIKQQIERGFLMCIYGYKFPDLSTIAYNHSLKHADKYDKLPRFYIINFDDPRRSHRCSPITPEFMSDISDAYESAYTIMLNLSRTWIRKQGDFFAESPIILFATIIWYLKIYENGLCCSFPHAIEFLNQPYSDIFEILMSYDELTNYLAPFTDARKGGAQDQLQGQLVSAKIPFTRMVSPQLYWVMTGNDFILDVNNPDDPKVLVVDNSPDRQNIYSVALGLYNSRIVKLINKKRIKNKETGGERRTLKSSAIIDELPTIYSRGLGNLIATARSNRVAVCLGFQDFSQLVRDYGDKEAKIIQNMAGNTFSGQAVGKTTKQLSERFDKVLQQRQSIFINRNDTSTSISTQLESIIPAPKISGLTQGFFVGVVTDEFDQRIEQKVFNAQIVVDVAKVKVEEKEYVKEMPQLLHNLRGEQLTDDELDQIVRANYTEIKKDVLPIVIAGKARIAKEQEMATA